MSWTCPNDDNDFCLKLKKPCRTAQKGCVLEGKVSRASDDESGGTPSHDSQNPPEKKKRKKGRVP